MSRNTGSPFAAICKFFAEFIPSDFERLFYRRGRRGTQRTQRGIAVTSSPKCFGPRIARITRTKRLKTSYPQIAQILADSVGAALRGRPFVIPAQAGIHFSNLSASESFFIFHQKYILDCSRHLESKRGLLNLLHLLLFSATSAVKQKNENKFTAEGAEERRAFIFRFYMSFTIRLMPFLR